MAARFSRPETPQRMPAPKPPRRRERDRQQIPGADMPPRHSPSKIAAKALQANPELSNRALAADARVSRMTVHRQRRLTEEYDSIEKTIGIDGKARPARRSERVAQPIPKGDQFDWAPEREEVVGPPGNRLQDVLARCGQSPAAHSASGSRNNRRRAEGRHKGGENV